MTGFELYPGCCQALFLNPALLRWVGSKIRLRMRRLCGVRSEERRVGKECS